LFWRRLYIAGRAASLLRNCFRQLRPLRGGHDAHRHWRELRGRRLRALADDPGTLAGNVAKRAAEGAEALPTGLERDVGDRQIGVAKQRRGFLDAPREQIAMRRHTEGFLELPREVGFGDAAHLREPIHRPGLVRGGIHSVLCAQQAAEELGILGGEVLAHPVISSLSAPLRTPRADPAALSRTRPCAHSSSYPRGTGHSPYPAANAS
jgi:hypothetical protein